MIPYLTIEMVRALLEYWHRPQTRLGKRVDHRMVGKEDVGSSFFSVGDKSQMQSLSFAKDTRVCGLRSDDGQPAPYPVVGLSGA
jgi:hypothetical protein